MCLPPLERGTTWSRVSSRLRSAAVLAGVVVAEEHRAAGERDAAVGTAHHVLEADNRRALHRSGGRVEAALARLQHLGLARHDEGDGAPRVGDVHRLVVLVEHQHGRAGHVAVLLSSLLLFGRLSRGCGAALPPFLKLILTLRGLGAILSAICWLAAAYRKAFATCMAGCDLLLPQRGHEPEREGKIWTPRRMRRNAQTICGGPSSWAKNPPFAGFGICTALCPHRHDASYVQRLSAGQGARLCASPAKAGPG